MTLRSIHSILAIGLFALGPAGIATAQTPALAVVRVHVTDTARVALSDADVAVVRNGTEVVLLGRTDAAGRYTFRLEPDSGRYRMTVRRLGYVQTARLLPVTPKETLTVEVSLARLPPALDTVRTTARPLPLAKQPYLGVDEIERDTRGIFNLNDILKKLRPDLFYQARKCVGPFRLYANGKMVFMSPWSELRSEHILELRYVNCYDQSIPGLPAKPGPSIYLTLKPGVGWDLKHGTYVADSVMYEAGEKERLGGAKPPR